MFLSFKMVYKQQTEGGYGGGGGGRRIPCTTRYVQ